MTIKHLKDAINAGCPVLNSIYDGRHYSVVYGYSSERIFVMNPSIGKMRSWSCAVMRGEFMNSWDRWGLVVSSR